VGQGAARLPGCEIGVPQLHRHGAGDETRFSDIGAGTIGEREQLRGEGGVVV
jgi:hypothetical protein